MAGGFLIQLFDAFGDEAFFFQMSTTLRLDGVSVTMMGSFLFGSSGGGLGTVLCPTSTQFANSPPFCRSQACSTRVLRREDVEEALDWLLGDGTIVMSLCCCSVPPRRMGNGGGAGDADAIPREDAGRRAMRGREVSSMCCSVLAGDSSSSTGRALVPPDREKKLEFGASLRIGRFGWVSDEASPLASRCRQISTTLERFGEGSDAGTTIRIVASSPPCELSTESSVSFMARMRS